jgi:AraC family transcriptional regulator
MEANVNQNIILNDIAEYAHLSPFHFHRVFKNITGYTTKEYLTRIRLEKAAQIITHNQCDIAQISVMVGYDNYETFTRAFKNYFQINPSQYRQEANKKITQKKSQYIENQVTTAKLNLDKPKLKFLDNLPIAFIRHTGSYSKVDKAWRKLFFWGAENLQISQESAVVGIVHDNHEITDTKNIRFDVCLLIRKNQVFKKEIEIQFKEIKGGKYAIFRFEGPYEDFYTVYDYIYSVCLDEFGFQLRDEPALEWYIKYPPFYQAKNYLTDFYVPIE